MTTGRAARPIISAALGAALGVMLAITGSAGALAQTASTPAPLKIDPLSPDQAEAVRRVVIDLLRTQPEILVEAIKALDAKEQAATAAKASEAIVAHRHDLEGDSSDPSFGQPSGDVTVVEFFDYRCPYCKQSWQAVHDAVRKDGHARLVFKDFPILGPESVTASTAALAAIAQGKHDAFHDALMSYSGQLNDTAIFRIAAAVGLDVDRLKADMKSAAVTDKLQRNMDLARALDVRGTPAFVVGTKLLPGAVDGSTLMAAIADARSAH